MKIVPALAILFLLIVIFIKINYVAFVDGRFIERDEFQKTLFQTERYYASVKQDSALTTPLRTDVLEKLIEEELVRSYAEEKKIVVTDEEVNARYQSVVKSFNQRNNITGGSDSKFLKTIEKMYGEKKEDYLEIIGMDILKEKVQAASKMSLSDWLIKQKKSVEIQRF